MKITEDICYIGVNDHSIDLFEGQYKVPKGMSYNSYLILDQKTAVLDTVDARYRDEWLQNLEAALGGRTPDYLVVHHMEPDHSANIAAFMDKYPQAGIVAGAKAFAMMRQFFGTDFEGRQTVVKEGSALELGRHTLTFIGAPMVHWPEVVMSYDSADQILFSADAFGKFGALDVEEDWAAEACRYYIGIVGKYGAQVQAVLKKAAALAISRICPLHGPVLSDDVETCLDLYNTWSSYRAEKSGAVIAYTSVYGHTREAALLLGEMLEKRGLHTVIYDLARDDSAAAVADAFRYDRLVLATTTYNAEIFPAMREYLEHLTERNFQSRLVALIENGSWAPTAAKGMMKLLEGSRNLAFAENTVHIKSALDETSRAALEQLAEELAQE